MAISIPACELTADPPPGSLFGWEHLAEARLSDDLRVALNLIERAARARGLDLVFIARPEIFTNSASLAWLRERLRGVQNHLCLSDGMAVRIVPQMQNHVFLYRQGIQASTDHFIRLMRRAPELIATLRAQVNTAYGVLLDRHRVAPPTLLLTGEDAPADDARLFRFYLDRRSAAQSAAVTLAAGLAEPHRLRRCRRIVYVPLTEVAARDRRFAELLARDLLAAFFDPDTGVVLRLPSLPAPAATAAERIAAALGGLCIARTELPRAIADTIVYADGDLDAGRLGAPAAELHLIMHETFEHWRHGPDFYAGCASVTIYAPWRRRADRHGMRALLDGLLGRRAELRWLPRDEPDDP